MIIQRYYNHLWNIKYVSFTYIYFPIKYDIGFDENFLPKFSSHKKIEILLKIAQKVF